MEFRKYYEEDAIEILKWIKTEREFRLWTADRYDKYPVTPDDINLNYKKCIELGNFYPMTLTDNDKIIGHLILRNPNNNLDIIKLGFIIVDDKLRGKGYGKTLIKKAISYAKNNLNAKEIALGVFANNKNAYNCYKASGFKEVSVEKNSYTFFNESWDCIEMILE